MEKGNKKLFIVGDKITIMSRLRSEYAQNPIENLGIEISILDGNDDDKNIELIKSEQNKYAVIIHADARNLDYYSGLINRINYIKRNFLRILFIFYRVQSK